MATEPGATFAYCSPGMHLLSAILARATGRPADAFAREVLWDPLGIEPVHWPRDPQGVAHGWGDVRMLPRDMAKLGFLYLHGGRWEGEPVVPSAWVRRATVRRVDTGSDAGSATASDGYGLGWWIPNGPLEPDELAMCSVAFAMARGGGYIKGCR